MPHALGSDPAHVGVDTRKEPYRHPQPTGMVPDDCEEMVTCFIVNGSLTYVEPGGRATGYDDVFTRPEICAKHFERAGLGRQHVQKFVR